MAFPHLRIKTSEDDSVHLSGPVVTDATLCGLDACDGDSRFGIEPPVKTKEPISCPQCLAIIWACRSLALCELPFTKPQPFRLRRGRRDGLGRFTRNP